MTLSLDINYHSGKWDTAPWEALLQPAADATLEVLQFSHTSELCLTLANDAFVQGLNAQYRGKDKPTNVLSFPQWEGEPPPSTEMLALGDIIMAYETIQRECTEQLKTMNDHVTHLFVHGLLHLLGYDHEENKEAEEMESIEIKVLATLNIANPYLSSYQ